MSAPIPPTVIAAPPTVVGVPPTAVPPVICEGVRIRYGRATVLDDVSLAVPAGCVYALLGRNGAGKSSLVRCLVGQQRAAAGRLRLFGLDTWKDRQRLMARVGVVPEEPDAPAELTPAGLLALTARLHPRWDLDGARARLERFAVPVGTVFGRLSKGQKGAVMLALALGHSPDLLILDDPTLGLDVVARDAVFRELIGELADRGTTVLVTTHDLAAIEGIADRVGILRDGRLVVDETIEALKGRYATPLEAIFAEVTGAAGGHA
jgi:ABC-2 type transport system ATP-binding protein